MLAVKAQEKNIELACSSTPLVPTFLAGDPGRLRQISRTSAITPSSSPTRARSSSISSWPGRRQIGDPQFEVRDTGIGIPADKLAELFSPFTQVDGSTTRKYGGTGLGLSISRQLAKLMGGQMGVESEEGKGSTFWFTVVLEDRPEKSRLVPTIDLSGTRVLVVDDHATNRMLMHVLLASWGCQATEVEDGETALRKLREAFARRNPYRIALVDMQMPGMDGEMLGSSVKSDPDLARTALIMITSIGQMGDAARAEKIGFSGYLVKPVREAKLRDMLRLVMDEKTSSSEKAILTRHSVEGQHTRILVAEDNATNQLVALKLLEKLGYRADVVASGREALRPFRPFRTTLFLWIVRCRTWTDSRQPGVFAAVRPDRPAARLPS